MTTASSAISCIHANNPSPMTGTGTNSYVLTSGDDCLIIDPGPDLAAHEFALTQAVQGRKLRGIIVTHAHLDHSELAPGMAARLDAPSMAFGGASSGRSPQMERLARDGLIAGFEGLDLDFSPDEVLVEGQAIRFGDSEVRVLHSPGHLGGHICIEWDDALFCGDHVMAWSTSLVSPPDGDMAAYMKSLRHLRDLNRWTRMLPGHGDVVTAPKDRLDQLITHRQSREAAILEILGKAAGTAQSVTDKVYADLPRHLLSAAERNVLAHLIALFEARIVTCQLPLAANSTFALS